MSLPRLIVVGGRKRAGKGTISQFLCERHGYVPLKFASTLKDMLSALYKRCGVDDETIERLLEGDLKEIPLPAHEERLPRCLENIPFFGASSRFAMQRLGSEWRDHIHPKLWVTITKLEVARALENGQNVVIDDLRFSHEHEVMTGLNATFWRVVNPRLPPNTETHGSEKELPDECYHQVFLNDGTIPELWDKLSKAL